MSKRYEPQDIEKKWQKIWQDEKAFAATDDYTKPKYYALVEFPYPSGQGLLSFTLVRNPGASLGMGSGATWVISLLAT